MVIRSGASGILSLVSTNDNSSAAPRTIGLCAYCRYVRPINSDRGATFYLCERGLRDPSFPKYPRLPVVSCRGYEPVRPDLASDEHNVVSG
jgi:hypothetical protein